MDEHVRKLVLNALRNAPVSASTRWIADRPDLQPLFGAMAIERMHELQDALVAADRLVTRLGEVTAAHLGLGCSVEPFSRSVLVRPSGSVDLDLSAFLSCGRADLAFEISFVVNEDSDRPPPWPVEAWIVVECTGPPGYTCNHTVLEDRQEAATPEDAVRILQEQIRAFTADVPRIPPDALIEHDHDDPRTWP